MNGLQRANRIKVVKVTKFTDEETGVRGVLYLVERMAGQLPDYVGTDSTDSTDTDP